MITGLANATMPPEREVSEVAYSSDSIAELSKPRVLFFAGDVIPPAEKYAEPFTKGFGGIFLPQLKTIQHHGNKGMIYRCKFTMMQVKMRAEPREMIAPGELNTWESQFTLKNNKFNAASGQWEDEVIRSDYMVYKPNLFPGKEVKRAIQRNPPNGVGGIVEIGALKDATRKDVHDVQIFFFPNWTEIQAGEASLPDSIRDLEAHIQQRMTAIRGTDWDQAKKDKYRSIAADMLRSCTEYRLFGQGYLKFIEDNINEAKVKGHSYAYPVLGEILLEQLEQSRKDDIVMGQNTAVSDLAKEISLDRNDRMALEMKRLEIEERKLAIEEAKLGIKPKSSVAVPVTVPEPVLASEPVLEESDEVRYCGRETATGTCQRVLKEGEMACYQHADK